jgi:hypothetical protein
MTILSSMIFLEYESIILYMILLEVLFMYADENFWSFSFCSCSENLLAQHGAKSLSLSLTQSCNEHYIHKFIINYKKRVKPTMRPPSVRNLAIHKQIHPGLDHVTFTTTEQTSSENFQQSLSQTTTQPSRQQVTKQ